MRTALHPAKFQIAIVADPANDVHRRASSVRPPSPA